jgi:hypothetical protein
MNNLITSQSYIDDNIVAAKIAEADYAVQVSPEIEYEGETFRVVLDDLNSLAAALDQGVAPELIELTGREHDAICLLDSGDIPAFFAAVQDGGEWHYALTDKPVW